MRDLDEVDLEIIQLLLTDGRRPYSDIAESVGLSPPAVSDRVDRLQELGIIQHFTIEIDRNLVSGAVPMFIELSPAADHVTEVFNRLDRLEETEHLYRLGDGTILVHGYLPTHDAHDWLDSVINLGAITEINAQPLAKFERNAGLRPDGFDLSCVICDNEVGQDGEFARFDGTVKAFCCESCLGLYEERYEAHAEAAK